MQGAIFVVSALDYMIILFAGQHPGILINNNNDDDDAVCISTSHNNNDYDDDDDSVCSSTFRQYAETLRSASAGLRSMASYD